MTPDTIDTWLQARNFDPFLATCIAILFLIILAGFAIEAWPIGRGR